MAIYTQKYEENDWKLIIGGVGIKIEKLTIRGGTIIRDSREAGRCPEYGFRPQMSRQMQVGHDYSLSRLDMPIHCHASPAKRFPPKTVNEKKFLSIQSQTFILTKNQSDYSMVL